MTCQAYRDEAAKQEAFEEAAKFKNQYRGLDDSEAEYLESLMDAKKKEEAAVRKDTLEQLDLFRKQQEDAERKALDEENNGPATTEDAQWIAGGRKRKKGNEGGLLKGLKLKKTASTLEDKSGVRTSLPTDSKTSSSDTKVQDAPVAKPTAPPKSSLSLGLGYESSDDDD